MSESKGLQPGEYSSYEDSGLGRPPICSIEIVDELLTALRATGCVSLACALKGISRQTFYNWLKKGRQEQQLVAQEDGGTRVRKEMVPYVHLVDNLAKVLAEAEAGSVLRIRKAGQGQPAAYDEDGQLLMAERAPSWQADAWLLERINPAKYGKLGREPKENEGENLEEGADLQELRGAAEELQ